MNKIKKKRWIKLDLDLKLEKYFMNFISYNIIVEINMSVTIS